MSALLFVQIVILIAIATAMTYYAMILLIKKSMSITREFMGELADDLDDEDDAEPHYTIPRFN